MTNDQQDVSRRLDEARESLGESRHHAERAGRAGMESIEEEWGRLKGEITDLIGNGALSHTPEVAAMLERLRDGVSRASDVIGDTGRQAQRRMARVAADADDYVHEEPWKIATMAALAGIAVGLLFSRR